MLYLSDVVAYFRYLCEQHPSLLHTETTGERVFEVLPLEEAFSALRAGAKEKDYLVRLLLPQISLSNQGENAAKGYEVSLLVLRYHGTREATKSGIVAALSNAEQVADNFFQRMVLDSRAGHPLFLGRADQASGLNMSGECVMNVMDGAYSGVLYSFFIATFRCLTGDFDVPWEDGGATPFPPSSELKQLPLYLNQQAALDDGLAVGDFYILDNGTDAGEAGQVMRVMPSI